VPFTAIVCLDMLSTGLFPHVNNTYIATSLIPRPVSVIGTFPESYPRAGSAEVTA
jgi:hypothetical protein